MATDLPQQVLELAKRVELRALAPTGTLAKTRAGEVLPGLGEQFNVHINLATGMTRTHDGFIGVVTVGVQAQRKEARRPFAHFIYRVNVQYAAAGDVTDEAIQTFVQTNGLVHVWPYARAWIQSASLSMGLPNVLLPFYRVQAPNAVRLGADRK